MKRIGFLAFLALFAISGSHAQIEVHGITIQTQNIATDLDTPWEILWGPDDHIWITERDGHISRVNPAIGDVIPILTIDAVHEESESGLLGMTLHPDFSTNPYVYVVYNYYDGGIRERVVRYTYADNSLGEPLILLENIPGSPVHNGSRISFGPDGMLYFTLGDASEASTAQDLEALSGKILRMTPTGDVPEDNPFTESLIYSYGHRNPQGLVFAPDGKLYSSEHGPANDDEVNLILEGRNYGWPNVHGFCDETSEMDFCTTENVVEPLAAWTPTLAVAGLDLYTHEVYPIWSNSLLLTSLKAGQLLSLELSENGESIIEEIVWIDDEFGRLRDLCISPTGRVFISTSNRDGRGDPAAADDRIIELIPENATSSSHQFSNQFSVYPNPSKGRFTVTMPEVAIDAQLSVFTTQGKLLRTIGISGPEHELDLTGMEKGIYILKLTTETGIQVQPILISN